MPAQDRLLSASWVQIPPPLLAIIVQRLVRLPRKQEMMVRFCLMAFGSNCERSGFPRVQTSCLLAGHSVFESNRAYFQLDVCPSGQRREAQDLPLSAAWVRIPSHLLIAMLAERYKALASKARASLMSEVRILHMAFRRCHMHRNQVRQNRVASSDVSVQYFRHRVL